MTSKLENCRSSMPNNTLQTYDVNIRVRVMYELGLYQCNNSTKGEMNNRKKERSSKGTARQSRSKELVFDVHAAVGK